MDVLDCLANLSNDEVFTSPAVVNRMLDTLPEALWSNPNAKFLDPVILARDSQTADERFGNGYT